MRNRNEKTTIMKYYTSILLFVLCFFNNVHAIDKQTILFPEVKLLKMDSTHLLTNSNLEANYNTIFINFSPTCEHCQQTIKSILNNISKFKETQFVLSSFEEFASIRKFYFDYFLDNYKNVHIGQEIDYNLTKQIKYASFPSLVIFDKNNNWVKTIGRETNAKTLLQILKIKAD